MGWERGGKCERETGEAFGGKERGKREGEGGWRGERGRSVGGRGE